MKKEHFEITSVGREDLESVGFDASGVNDSKMEKLASMMSDAYLENGYWIDLPIIAEHLEIPKKKSCNSCDCYKSERPAYNCGCGCHEN